MRKKIAKRKRREILKRGAVISNAHFVKEPGWRRKDCGYTADISYLGWNIGSNGFDMLECWQAGLECMDFVEEEVIKDLLDPENPYDPYELLEDMRDDYPYFYERAKKEMERISNEL